VNARPARRLVLLLALLACGPGPEAGPPPAPVGIEAGIVVEPPRLEVGRVVSVDVAVITPPDHRVPPVKPPARVPGFWILDAEPLPVVQERARWIHRTRIHARAREVGRFEWPASQVVVEAPDGSREELALEPRPLEVVSVLPEGGMGLDPLPLRGPRARSGSQGFLLPAAAGSLATLAGVALVSALRRRRHRGPTPAPVAAPEPPPPDGALAGLDLAERLLGSDPRGAANATSAALRRHLAERYRVDAEVRTTEELARVRAPFGATRIWPRALAVLRALDAARFPPAGDGLEAVTRAIAEARALVGEAERGRPGGPAS
jgi:hypothetical protein